MVEYVELNIEGKTVRLEDYVINCSIHKSGWVATVRNLFLNNKPVMAYLPITSINTETTAVLTSMDCLTDLVLTEQSFLDDLYPKTKKEIEKLVTAQNNLLQLDGVNIYIGKYHVNLNAG